MTATRQFRQREEMDLAQLQHAMVATSPPITVPEIDYMFCAMIWHPQLFYDAKRELSALCFNPHTEAHYSALWQVMYDLTERHHSVSYQLLVTECQQRIAADNGSSLLPSQADFLVRPDPNGLIYSYFFGLPPHDITERYGREVLVKFLHERQIAAPLKAIINKGYGGSFVANLPAIIKQTIDRMQRITGMSAMPVCETMPDRLTYKAEPEQYTPTGIDFIDLAITGERAGDANGLLGPFGAGKSTLLRYMAVSKAKYWNREAFMRGTKSKVVFLLSYEEPLNKFKFSLWSTAAHIPRNKLSTMTDYNQLGEDGPLLDYERDLFRPGSNQDVYPIANAAAGHKVATSDAIHPGERSRWDTARLWMNAALCVADMSGSGDFPDSGFGYVDEIVSYIERYCSRNNVEVGGVYIDWAGMCCQRHMMKNGIPEERLRYYLGNFGDLCRQKLSEHFKCTTWIAHQVSGDANGRPCTTALSHSDAGESKSFASGLAVCGCLGNWCRQTGCRYLNWSKVRYAVPPSSIPILRMHDHFAELYDVSKKYYASIPQRRFVSYTESAQIHGEVPTGRHRNHQLDISQPGM